MAQPPVAALQMTIEHDGPIVLGESPAEIPVTITVPESRENANVPLRVSANVGRFGPVERLGAGTYRTAYHLPPTRYPQVVLVAIWRETGVNAPVEIRRIALCGRTVLPVRARRRSSVLVRVGEQTFGPVKTRRRRRVQVPIVVPPGVDTVEVEISRRRRTRTAAVDVNVPPYNRLTLAVTPHRVLADGHSSVMVHAYYDADDTVPLLEDIVLKTRRGTIEPLDADGKRYRFRFVPTQGLVAAQALIRAEVRGRPADRADAKVTIGAGEPHHLAVTSQPATAVAASAEPITMDVLVTDRWGLGVSQLQPDVSLVDGRLEAVQDQGNGLYRITILPPARYPTDGSMRLAVGAHADCGSDCSVVQDVSVRPPPWPANVAVSVQPEAPVADGTTPFRVSIRAFDAAGEPLPDAGLLLAIDDRPAVPVAPGSDRGLFSHDVVPDADIASLSLVLKSTHGGLHQEQTVRLSSPPPAWSVDVWGGVSFDRRWSPGGGLGVGWRPRLNRGMSTYARVGYRQAHLGAETADGEAAWLSGDYEAILRLAHFEAGVKYDIYTPTPSFGAYVGAGLGLIGYAHTTQSRSYGGFTERSLGYTAATTLGLQLLGIFAEARGILYKMDGRNLNGPRWGVSLAAGYRFGLF